MQATGMYGDRAELYELLYRFKDYAAEAAEVAARLRDLGVPPGARVLEAACGTGSHLVHLAEDFAVAGFDLNEGMLAQARAKLPGVELFRADMAELRVGAPYDALLCLFSSIGYVFPRDRLDATARAFFQALRPGGVALVEPWFEPDAWSVGRPHLQTYEDEAVKLCRANVSAREGELSVLDFHWLVARKDAPAVEHFTERHSRGPPPPHILSFSSKENLVTTVGLSKIGTLSIW